MQEKLRSILKGIKTKLEELHRFLTQPKRLGKWKVKPRFLIVCGTAVMLCVLIVLAIIIFSGGTKEMQAQSRQETAQAAGETDLESMPLNTATPVPALPTTEPEPVPTPMRLKKGMTDEEVAKLQERLMELDYMDRDLPTDYFGPATEYSLELFQRKHDLQIDGIYGDETKLLLFSDQAKKYTVTVGITGTDVKEIQKRLNDLDYLDKVTDYFGDETEAAVKEFQKKNGLETDGSVGMQTREVLFSDTAKPFFFAIGTSGEEVLKLQQRLFALGYLTTEPDGVFGKDTENGIKRFQQRNGFIDDGYAGPQTRELLFSSGAEKNALGVGDSGSDVINVQQRLIELKYLRGKADGYFGSNTEGAVTAFQKRNGLTDDGKVGAHTLGVLLSDSAKKASSSSGGSSGGGSSGGGSSGGGSSEDDSSGGSDDSARDKSVDSLIKVAKSKLGAKYVRGAKGPNSFDCSGFVYWCLNQIGVKQGYMTSASWAVSNKYPVVKSLDKLKPGDIISFKGHVGIALGGGKMIDAAPSGGGVRIGNLSHSYWIKNFIRAYRVL